jgi:hypothetical protein
MKVTNRVVTTNTTRAGVSEFRVGAFNSIDNVLMTLPAGLFCYLPTARRDVNVVFIPARREVVRMPETISRLGGILADESGRRVAIIANSHRTMARLQPTAKLVLHDMTIHARFSVVSHVRITTRVDERVGAHTDSYADGDTQDYTGHHIRL